MVAEGKLVLGRLQKGLRLRPGCEDHVFRTMSEPSPFEGETSTGEKVAGATQVVRDLVCGDTFITSADWFEGEATDRDLMMVRDAITAEAARLSRVADEINGLLHHREPRKLRGL